MYIYILYQQLLSTPHPKFPMETIGGKQLKTQIKYIKYDK